MLKMADADQAKSVPAFAVFAYVANDAAVEALPNDPSPSRRSGEFGFGFPPSGHGVV